VQQRVTVVKPDLPTFFILPTYDFKLERYASTVILITCQSQSVAPKDPKLMHSYTSLIGPEAWLSTIGRM